MANSIIGRDMAVDLGTANTLVYVRGRGIMLDEPSVVALNDTTGEVLAVGHEAKRMIGRTPDNITALRPMKDGVIADFEATEQMLRFFIQQVHRRRYFTKPRMVICVPSGITAVEQRAVKEAGYQAGARKVYIIEEPMAAAIGAGLPVHQAAGNMVVDVGGGTTEVAVISLGGVVTSLSIRTAGDDLDTAIVAWMKKEYSLMLGERTAEEVKMTLGSAFPTHEEPEAEIRGRDMISGLPALGHGLERRGPQGARGAAARDHRRRPLHARLDAARAGRRHHGPRHRAHRRRGAPAWPRRAAAPRDRDAGPRRRGPSVQRGDGRRQVRRGVRGAPAGPGLGASAVLRCGLRDLAPPRLLRGYRPLRPGPDSFDQRADRSRLRSRMVALVLACLTLMTLDHHTGTHSPLEPARSAVGSVFGPVESVSADAVRPVTSVGDWFRTRKSMQNDIASLEAQNSRLRAQNATGDYTRNQLAEFQGLTSAAGTLGQALVPAHVVAYGPAQSFSRTVTVDAGSNAGVRPDQTVLDDDGLVGRVLRVTPTTATVLLIVDTESVVGGRVGTDMKVGFLRGQGGLGDHGTLDLELVDQSDAPTKGDTIVTWGSHDGAPYVSGVPIGRVTAVYASLRESTQRAVIQPFVDFGALDLVGIVVPSGTQSDRGVIEADGSLQ